jgi:Flp pilus assembly protein TadD
LPPRALTTAQWQAQAETLQQTATPTEYQTFCRRWAAAEPENYQPYNALGRYLEKQGDVANALAAFRKSIDLEWNQPFATQAIVRLERRLAEAAAAEE